MSIPEKRWTWLPWILINLSQKSSSFSRSRRHCLLYTKYKQTTFNFKKLWSTTFLLGSWKEEKSATGTFFYCCCIVWNGMCVYIFILTTYFVIPFRSVIFHFLQSVVWVWTKQTCTVGCMFPTFLSTHITHERRKKMTVAMMMMAMITTFFSHQKNCHMK